MKKPFLSVLIATYNRKNLLQRAIKSIQNQNFDDYEIIISDDGSNDGTAEFCKDLCQKDKRIFATQKPLRPSHHAIFVKTARHNKKRTNRCFLKQNAQILAVLADKPACKHGVFIIKHRHLPACKGINRL